MKGTILKNRKVEETEKEEEERARGIREKNGERRKRRDSEKERKSSSWPKLGFSLSLSISISLSLSIYVMTIYLWVQGNIAEGVPEACYQSSWRSPLSEILRPRGRDGRYRRAVREGAVSLFLARFLSLARSRVLLVKREILNKTGCY